MSNLLASNWQFYVVLGVILVGGFVLMYFKNKKEQKQREENKQKLDALPVGTEILSIGMIKGAIVKNEGDYIVISTGDEENKGYITLHKNGIYKILTEEATEEVKEEPFTEDTVDEQEIIEEEVMQEKETPTEDEISD